MANFINTVDSIGDDALTDSIIDRSVVNYYDDNVTTIGAYAFSECNNLIKAYCPSVTSIKSNAFNGCEGLTEIYFPKVTTIEGSAFSNCDLLKLANLPTVTSLSMNAFRGCGKLEKVDFSMLTRVGGYSYSPSYLFAYCRALTTVILRNETIVPLTELSVFDSTPITSGTGYIYVPRALIEDYKVASNWSTYANQFRAIEDYPYINDPYTWEAVQAAINDGVYKLYYNIGDTIPMELSSGETIDMRIAGFDVDTLADGSGIAPITWLSKSTYGFFESVYNETLRVANDDGTYQLGTGNIGGWKYSYLRENMNDNLLPLFPETVKDMIVSVTKTDQAFDVDGSSYCYNEAVDRIWCPSSNEIEETYKPMISKIVGNDNALTTKIIYDVFGRGKNIWTRSNYVGFTDRMTSLQASSTGGGSYISGKEANASCPTIIGFCT